MTQHFDAPSLSLKNILKAILKADPYLTPYAAVVERRLKHIESLEHRLTGAKIPLSDFALSHEYFGLHQGEDQWIFREWAPNATAMYLIGEHSDWQVRPEFALQRSGPDGVWEIRLPEHRLRHGNLYRLHLAWPGGAGDRIPAYVRRVVQDAQTLIFNAQVWAPPTYDWRHRSPARPANPLIYEAHIGMAQEEGKIGTYREFTKKVLPRIIRAGYNTLQLMGIVEHPYYASFGYHVTSFYAASSRFGAPEELKELIDNAHGAGLSVIMDIIHSHAASNEVEGLSRFDGTAYAYFHDGARGRHVAWDSRCFDYSKPQTLSFLLSNCRFWLDEYRFDGFRFDGITSMLYRDHGLEKAFTSYDDYFGDNVDEDALAYLALACRLIHEIRPDAIAIAEDVSGLPLLAAPQHEGGIGFDYRLAMGIADVWIKLIKEYRDEDWPIGHLWYELTQRRADEKTISYAESHDQALVGDKTLMFRLADAAMYDAMNLHDHNLTIDRAMALSKMIRLITLATAGSGYLNFMGNEFGHPEWVDFPREGNGWSYHYARRQWHLADDPNLKYACLARFDREMLALVRQYDFLSDPWPRLLHEHADDKVLVFSRGPLIFAFNFHPTVSYPDYGIASPSGAWQMILNTDDTAYGGHSRLIFDQVHFTLPVRNHHTEHHVLPLYLPSRSALVLKKNG